MKREGGSKCGRTWPPLPGGAREQIACRRDRSPESGGSPDVWPVPIRATWRVGRRVLPLLGKSPSSWTGRLPPSDCASDASGEIRLIRRTRGRPSHSRGRERRQDEMRRPKAPATSPGRPHRVDVALGHPDRRGAPSGEGQQPYAQVVLPAIARLEQRSPARRLSSLVTTLLSPCLSRQSVIGQGRAVGRVSHAVTSRVKATGTSHEAARLTGAEPANERVHGRRRRPATTASAGSSRMPGRGSGTAVIGSAARVRLLLCLPS